MEQVIKGSPSIGLVDVTVDYHRSIRLSVDNFRNLNCGTEYLEILWIMEPNVISNIRARVIDNHKKFDIILTYDQEILDVCENAYFMAFGTTWIQKDYDITKPKKFAVSHIVGHKLWTPLHHLRHKVHYKQKKITIPTDFYISRFGGVDNFNNNKVLGVETKDPLFVSQFHICIENSAQKNYFTEKLVDCFLTKTVPIYCGCDNIGEFFDLRGMIIAKDAKEIIAACNELTEDSYAEMLKYVEINYEVAKGYSELPIRFAQTVEKILNK